MSTRSFAVVVDSRTAISPVDSTDCFAHEVSLVSAPVRRRKAVISFKCVKRRHGRGRAGCGTAAAAVGEGRRDEVG